MITKEDIEHLKFIHNRLIKVHAENKHYDYMVRMRDIIEKMESLQQSSTAEEKKCECGRQFYIRKYCKICDNDD